MQASTDAAARLEGKGRKGSSQSPAPFVPTAILARGSRPPSAARPSTTSENVESAKDDRRSAGRTGGRPSRNVTTLSDLLAPHLLKTIAEERVMTAGSVPRRTHAPRVTIAAPSAAPPALDSSSAFPSLPGASEANKRHRSWSAVARGPLAPSTSGSAVADQRPPAAEPDVGVDDDGLADAGELESAQQRGRQLRSAAAVDSANAKEVPELSAAAGDEKDASSQAPKEDGDRQQKKQQKDEKQLKKKNKKKPRVPPTLPHLERPDQETTLAAAARAIHAALSGNTQAMAFLVQLLEPSDLARVRLLLRRIEQRLPVRAAQAGKAQPAVALAREVAPAVVGSAAAAITPAATAAAAGTAGKGGKASSAAGSAALVLTAFGKKIGTSAAAAIPAQALQTKGGNKKAAAAGAGPSAGAGTTGAVISAVSSSASKRALAAVKPFKAIETAVEAGYKAEAAREKLQKAAVREQKAAALASMSNTSTNSNIPAPISKPQPEAAPAPADFLPSNTHHHLSAAAEPFVPIELPSEVIPEKDDEDDASSTDSSGDDDDGDSESSSETGSDEDDDDDGLEADDAAGVEDAAAAALAVPLEEAAAAAAAAATALYGGWHNGIFYPGLAVVAPLVPAPALPTSAPYDSGAASAGGSPILMASSALPALTSSEGLIYHHHFDAPRPVVTALSSLVTAAKGGGAGVGLSPSFSAAALPPPAAMPSFPLTAPAPLHSSSIAPSALHISSLAPLTVSSAAGGTATVLSAATPAFLPAGSRTGQLVGASQPLDADAPSKPQTSSSSSAAPALAAALPPPVPLPDVNDWLALSTHLPALQRAQRDLLIKRWLAAATKSACRALGLKQPKQLKQAKEKDKQKKREQKKKEKAKAEGKDKAKGSKAVAIFELKPGKRSKSKSGTGDAQEDGRVSKRPSHKNKRLTKLKRANLRSRVNRWLAVHPEAAKAHSLVTKARTDAEKALLRHSKVARLVLRLAAGQYIQRREDKRVARLVEKGKLLQNGLSPSTQVGPGGQAPSAGAGGAAVVSSSAVKGLAAKTAAALAAIKGVSNKPGEVLPVAGSGLLTAKSLVSKLGKVPASAVATVGTGSGASLSKSAVSYAGSTALLKPLAAVSSSSGGAAAGNLSTLADLPRRKPIYVPSRLFPLRKPLQITRKQFRKALLHVTKKARKVMKAEEDKKAVAQATGIASPKAQAQSHSSSVAGSATGSTSLGASPFALSPLLASYNGLSPSTFARLKKHHQASAPASPVPFASAPSPTSPAALPSLSLSNLPTVFAGIGGATTLDTVLALRVLREVKKEALRISLTNANAEQLSAALLTTGASDSGKGTLAGAGAGASAGGSSAGDAAHKGIQLATLRVTGSVDPHLIKRLAPVAEILPGAATQKQLPENKDSAPVEPAADAAADKPLTKKQLAAIQRRQEKEKSKAVARAQQAHAKETSAAALFGQDQDSHPYLDELCAEMISTAGYYQDRARAALFQAAGVGGFAKATAGEVIEPPSSGSAGGATGSSSTAAASAATGAKAATSGQGKTESGKGPTLKLIRPAAGAGGAKGKGAVSAGAGAAGAGDVDGSDPHLLALPASKKRIVVGLREVHRGCKSGKIKLVIVAPNVRCDDDDEEGGVAGTVRSIIEAARGARPAIPVIFALNRRRIAQALGHHVKASVVGFYSLESLRGIHLQAVQLAEALRRNHAHRLKGEPLEDLPLPPSVELPPEALAGMTATAAAGATVPSAAAPVPVAASGKPAPPGKKAAANPAKGSAPKGDHNEVDKDDEASRALGSAPAASSVGPRVAQSSPSSSLAASSFWKRGNLTVGSGALTLADDTRAGKDGAAGRLKEAFPQLGGGGASASAAPGRPSISASARSPSPTKGIGSPPYAKILMRPQPQQLPRGTTGAPADFPPSALPSVNDPELPKASASKPLPVAAVTVNAPPPAPLVAPLKAEDRYKGWLQ